MTNNAAFLPPAACLAVPLAISATSEAEAGPRDIGQVRYWTLPRPRSAPDAGLHSRARLAWTARPAASPPCRRLQPLLAFGSTIPDFRHLPSKSFKGSRE